MTDALRHVPPASPRDLRNFGITFTVVFSIIAAWLRWKGRGASPYFGAAAAAFGVITLLAPAILRPLHSPWMKFAEVLGVINTKLLLALFFFVGLTPIGALMRVFGNDPMNRTFAKRKAGVSYWTAPPKHPDGARHFTRQF